MYMEVPPGRYSVLSVDDDDEVIAEPVPNCIRIRAESSILAL
jgi:hypothetical protein